MENSQAQLLALFAKAVQQLQDNHIDYAPALEKGNVHTPMKAWRARKELSMLCPTLDPAEIGILVVAAKLLTGIQRDDRFDSVSEFVGFMKDEAAQDAAVYAEHLWNLGFRNFGAISYAFQVDAVAMALLIDETDVAGSKSIPVRAFAGKHADLVRQEYALRQPLPSPIIATLKSSAAQTDTERKTHPDAVRPWSTFEEEVNLHVAEIPTYPGSKPRFCQIAGDAQQGGSKEEAVSQFWNNLIEPLMNSGIKYRGRLGLQPLQAEWVSQGNNIPLDVDVDAEDAQAELVENARPVITGSTYDKYLKTVATGRVHRRGRSLAELKRLERLLLDLHGFGTALLDQDAPDIIGLWNNPERSSLCKNAVGIIAQFNDYTSQNGIRFGVIGNAYWLWALRTDGGNNIDVSPPIRYNSVQPTVLQVVDFITCQALGEGGLGDSWNTKLEHPKGPLSTWPKGSHARRQRSGLPPVPESGNGGAAAPSAGPSDVALGSSRATESVGVSVSGEGSNLEKAAAELKRKQVFGVVGRGALGAAYGVRLPDGSQLAVKVAPCGSEKEMQLRHEAKGYLTVRELWKVGVPELLLAGPLLAIGAGYGIGTALVPGHPLRPGDRDLHAAARNILQRVHAKGVIHGDLREDNFIVTQHGGKRDIYLIDFSHCRFTSDRSAQEDELGDLDDLFENL